MPKRPPKNTAQNSDARRGPERDALGRLRGGNPGNSGGKRGRSGRLKTEVRALCQQAFEEAVPVLRAMALGKLPEVSNGDRIRAADVLARYGGMTYTETEARLDVRPAPTARIVTYRLPENGMGPGEQERTLAEWVKGYGSWPPFTPAATRDRVNRWLTEQGQPVIPEDLPETPAELIESLWEQRQANRAPKRDADAADVALPPPVPAPEWRPPPNGDASYRTRRFGL